jgi:ABC-type polysaccharide/polyol phosphate transport system ATPase subunit
MAHIELRHVSVEFPIYNVSARSFKKSFLRLATGGTISKNSDNQHLMIRSLNNISLSLQHGDRVGLIGHNGAGKSTFLRLLATIYEPTMGNISIEGHISSILNLTQGIESECTGYENIIIRGTLLGISRKQIKKQIEEISALTGLGDYLAMPVRTYSLGMMVRLAFAISTSIQPDILLIDEVFSAGDADFMQKAVKKINSLLIQSSIVVMASHSDELIREFCNKALLLEGGEVKYFGDVEQALSLYHHKAKES